MHECFQVKSPNICDHLCISSCGKYHHNNPSTPTPPKKQIKDLCLCSEMIAPASPFFVSASSGGGAEIQVEGLRTSAGVFDELSTRGQLDVMFLFFSGLWELFFLWKSWVLLLATLHYVALCFSFCSRCGMHKSSLLLLASKMQRISVFWCAMFFDSSCIAAGLGRCLLLASQ